MWDKWILPYGPAIAAIAVLLGAVVYLRRRLNRKKAELRALVGEEVRMFDFLHDLGLAIGSDSSNAGLYRIIVNGISEVIASHGGALYLLDDAGEFLEPKCLTDETPALVPVPDEVLEQERANPGAIDSHLRLQRVPADTGVLGRTLALGDALKVPDLAADESFRDGYPGGRRRVHVLLAPIRHGERDLGVLALTRNGEGQEFSQNDFAVFRSAAEQSGFALGNALLYREANEKRQIESDLRNASEVQRVLLPQAAPEVPGFRLAGMNIPARIISGDYYDYLDLGEGRHGLVIADVSGKGVSAGLLMAMCRAVLRSRALGGMDPAEVLALVNHQLFPDIREDMFISLFYAVVEEGSGTVRLARAGHDEALHFRAGARTVEAVKPPGLALGIDDGGVFSRVTRVAEVAMESGDCLLFYTDGVCEAVDESGEEFGPERLRRVFREAAPLGAEATVEAVQRELELFSGEGPQMDDITMLALEKR